MSASEPAPLRLIVSHDNGGLVGELTFTPQEDRWTFKYDAEWRKYGAFQLSPAFPFQPPAGAYDSHAIRRFIVNLFPEGAPLRAAVEQLHVSPGNAFALLRSMGGETTGALEFRGADQPVPEAGAPHRLLPREELAERVANAKEGGLTVWDGKVRMSIAGYQDKLAVFALDNPGLEPNASMWLAEPPIASTFILKPQPHGDRTPHLVVNEHFCMRLAAQYGAPVPEVAIMRLPTPVLVVPRFDRQFVKRNDRTEVSKQHVIDACQACDLPVEMKYERPHGNTGDLALIRDGMSLRRLFGTAPLMRRPAATKLEFLRWALFQVAVGNSDAHGKNFSFFVDRELLDPAPWYDIVCVEQYPQLDNTFAMAFGDAFTWDELTPFELAHFAHTCEVDRRLLHRETQRLARALSKAETLLDFEGYTPDERDFLRPIAQLAAARSQALVEHAKKAEVFTADHF